MCARFMRQPYGGEISSTEKDCRALEFFSPLRVRTLELERCARVLNGTSE